MEQKTYKLLPITPEEAGKHLLNVNPKLRYYKIITLRFTPETWSKAYQKICYLENHYQVKFFFFFGNAKAQQEYNNYIDNLYK